MIKNNIINYTIYLLIRFSDNSDDEEEYEDGSVKSVHDADCSDEEDFDEQIKHTVSKAAPSKEPKIQPTKIQPMVAPNKEPNRKQSKKTYSDDEDDFDDQYYSKKKPKVQPKKTQPKKTQLKTNEKAAAKASKSEQTYTAAWKNPKVVVPMKRVVEHERKFI